MEMLAVWYNIQPDLKGYIQRPSDQLKNNEYPPDPDMQSCPEDT